MDALIQFVDSLPPFTALVLIGAYGTISIGMIAVCCSGIGWTWGRMRR